MARRQSPVGWVAGEAVQCTACLEKRMSGSTGPGSLLGSWLPLGEGERCRGRWKRPAAVFLGFGEAPPSAGGRTPPKELCFLRGQAGGKGLRLGGRDAPRRPAQALSAEDEPQEATTGRKEQLTPSRASKQGLEMATAEGWAAQCASCQAFLARAHSKEDTDGE